MEWYDTHDENAGMPIVVSFFTDPFYMREAFELVRSCQYHGIDYHVKQVPHRGSWLENTNYKPTFILAMARRYPNRSLLWLDADARVRQDPILFYCMTHTIAYRTIEKVPASGTVYLAAWGVRERLLLEWIEEVEHHPTITDQVCMERAVNNLMVPRAELPPEYCWIYDDDPRARGRRFLDHDDTPVIEHMQASRLAKKQEGRNRGKVRPVE